jgi:hypothetical protein
MFNIRVNREDKPSKVKTQTFIHATAHNLLKIGQTKAV